MILLSKMIMVISKAVSLEEEVDNGSEKISLESDCRKDNAVSL
jgi:hypothetical protein